MTAPLPPDPADVLTRLEELHKAATPGPWQYDPSEGDTVWDSKERRPSIIALTRDPYGNCEADAAAIVAEHNAMPALLAAVRGVLALAEELDREMAERGFRLDRIALPGDRLRRALAGPDDTQQDGAR